MRRVADVVYSSPGRLVTMNYVGVERVDALQYGDGIFSEDYNGHVPLLLSAGLSTTGKVRWICCRSSVHS